MSNRKVEEFLYEPRTVLESFGNRNWKPDLDHCRFSVAEHGRITTWHQCTRKGVEKIDGYGFCKQHSKEVRRRLGIFSDQEIFIKYAAEFSYGKPSLVELKLLSETEKMIEVQSSKKIMGSNHIINGKQLKRSNYIRYEYFYRYEDAILWLYQQSEKHWISMRAALASSVETMNELASLVRKQSEEA